MSQSVKIRSFYIKNAIGIQTGLNKKEFEIDFTKLYDKHIILILGDNATGKTTFMSMLHCLPGTTDGRREFITEGKEGIKKVIYDRSDGYQFECKIIYSPSKTGHNSKGFVKKINPNGDEIELNENGNITSYKEVVAEELGITDAILKLASQNDVCKGHVDMTSTERKLNMSTFLPDDIYSSYYDIADKLYKELKMRINILVDSLGKLHDEDTLKTELVKVTDKINDLVAKRDKCMSKISECQTRITVIRENGIEDRAKKLNKEIRNYYDDIEDIQKSIESLYSSLNSFLTRDSTLDRISSAIGEVSKQAKEKEILSRIEISTISDLKLKRNSLSEQILEKENSISDLETDHSLSELKDILSKYMARLKDLDRLTKGADISVTKDMYMIGYGIIKNIRLYIDDFGNYDESLVNSICNNEFIDFKHDEVLTKLHELEKEKADIMAKISSLDFENSSDSVLGKRPKDCIIDSCPFIATAYKLKKIQDKVPEYTDRIDKIEQQIRELNIRLEYANQKDEIENKISILMNYVNANMAIISKLPFHEKYSTLESLKKAIKRGGSTLCDCDDFESFIEKLEYVEEKTSLEDKKIPQVKHEIELLETKGMFIDSTRNELKNLQMSKDAINMEISKHEGSLKTINESLEYFKEILEALSSFHDKKSEYNTIYDQIMNDDKELKEISIQLEEIQSYAEKISEKKERLKEIDDELNPLTRQREVYKMEQLKLASFKDELAAVQEDMYKCEIVRAALSVKDNGIPVSALEWFMDTVRQTANSLLSQSFNGNLYLDEFIINTKDFIIPYHKNGDYGLDVSYASSSERSFISLCLTMAMMEEITSKYTLCLFDEIDRGMSSSTKSKFIEILDNAICRAGIAQMFMITHNYQFYQGYDCGYIAFPGSELNDTDEDDIIRVERE